MTQKCDGVKILDLEEKLEATGGEYIVTAEKDNNYKLPLESVADIVIGSSKFKAAIKDVYESSTPTASVSLDKDQFLFSFGIPAGRTGNAGRTGKDGKDGKDGIDGVPGIDGDTTRVVIAYKSTKTIQRPDTPVGGSWDYDTNTITYPEGWSGSDSNPNGYVWMSTATFSSKGTIVVHWSTPVRLTGADGHDGADGSIATIDIDGATFQKVVSSSNPAANKRAELSIDGLSINMGIPKFYVNDEGMSYQHYAGSSTVTDFKLDTTGAITIGQTGSNHAIINSGSFSLKNSTLDNIVITYDNTTSSITLNNPTGIDSSRVVIKALDDDAEDSVSVRTYDSQGNYSSITPTGISSSNGVDKWIIINNDYIAVHTPEGSDTGWTGTKNGLRFQCGICVGEA